MRNNRFDGIDRSLFEVKEKSERWCTDSSDDENKSSIEHTGEERVEIIVGEKV
jgi:hypothetical protein